MRSQIVLFSILLGACGGSPRPVCPEEQHLADPDGRGARCIDDQSTCDAPSDCETGGDCCTVSCVEASGTGVFGCTQSCRQPDCTDVSCGPGFVCQSAEDECIAHCVPDDVECPEGMIPADPDGSGTFICIREDSACFAPSDCAPDPTGCCVAACREGADDRWVCDMLCDGDGSAERDEGMAWECATDADCDAAMGGVGWTCVTGCGGNYCEPPAACVTADDCALAIDTSDCCGGCAQAVPRSVLGEGCWAEYADADSDPPGGGAEPAPPRDECTPDCREVMCPLWECAQPAGVDCQGGTCVPVGISQD